MTTAAFICEYLDRLNAAILAVRRQTLSHDAAANDLAAWWHAHCHASPGQAALQRLAWDRIQQYRA